MATFVICHGAWSAGWAWKKIRPRLQAAGHTIFTPSYTGLGERAHLTSPQVNLETHIADILGVIQAEGLTDITLLGHSYGGMVATGVADRAAPLIRHLIYLDAFVPTHNQSLDDLTGRTTTGDIAGWLVSPMPSAPDTSPDDIEWTKPRRMPQPAGCFTQKLALTGASETLRRTYIHCSKKIGHDTFAQFRDRLAGNPAWGFIDMPESHSPNITAPDALAAILLSLAE